MKRLFFFFLGLLIALPAYAAQGTETVLTPPVGTGILPGTSALSSNFKSSLIFSKVIPFAIRFGIGLAMVLAVGVLILAGYQYMTAYGNEEKHEKAKNMIIYAMVGLVAAIMAYGLVTLVTSFRFGLTS